MKRRANRLLAAGLAICMVASSACAAASSAAVSSPNWKALILELLILLPLAAVALKLRSRKSAATAANSNDEIKLGKPIRLANGAQAQLIYANNHAVLVVLGKDGASSLLALSDEASPIQTPGSDSSAPKA